MSTEQHGLTKDHVSASLLALRLPAQTLQHLWRGSGYLVPDELDRLISLLHETRDAHRLSFSSLKKEYEEYVAICKSFDITPDDPLSSKNDWKTLTELEESSNSKTEEKPLDIPLRFARIDKLKAAEQVLSDIDLITEVLVKVRKRFSDLDKHKTGDIRLFISARGTSIAMQLVYEPKKSKLSRLGRVPGLREAEPNDDVEVQGWLEMGRRALEREKTSFRFSFEPETEVRLSNEASSELDSTLDRILTILEKDRRERVTSKGHGYP